MAKVLTPEEAILAHVGNAPAEGFKEYMALTDDVLAHAELSERERSRVRILRAFMVAAVEVINDEIQRGAPGPELLVDVSDALGNTAAGLVVQCVEKRGWRGATKRLTESFNGGMKKYMKLVELADG